MTKHVNDAQHMIIYKDPFAYCAHPHIAKLSNGEWLLVFNQTVRRPYILHPPEDPRYYNCIMRSNDQGHSWNMPRVAPNYDWYGVECAGLTSLSDGTVLLNQWRFRWYPLEMAQKVANTAELTFPQAWVDELKESGELETGYSMPANPAEIAPWVRGNGGTYVHRSTDLGRTWDQTIEIQTTPYSGGYGMRGAVELSQGDILLPLSDVPHYRTVFVVRSTDGGCSWGKPLEVASRKGKYFEEPCALALDHETVLMLLRENSTHYLYQTLSKDGGSTWSEPVKTPIWGYPAHLLMLQDNRVLCVYGYRRPPYGIRAVVSSDQGKSWDVESPWIIRDDLPNADLGYPGSVLIDDGDLFTVYYGQDPDGVTCIQASRYFIE